MSYHCITTLKLWNSRCILVNLGRQCLPAINQHTNVNNMDMLIRIYYQRRVAVSHSHNQNAYDNSQINNNNILHRNIMIMTRVRGISEFHVTSLIFLESDRLITQCWIFKWQHSCRTTDCARCFIFDLDLQDSRNCNSTWSRWTLIATHSQFNCIDTPTSSYLTAPFSSCTFIAWWSLWSGVSVTAFHSWVTLESRKVHH